MKRRKRKCRHCRGWFIPDCRNHHHQHFCSNETCRKASKKRSQRKWLKKPENSDYFKNSDNINRVKQWRKKHPQYWERPQFSSESPRKLPDETFIALQDVCIPQPLEVGRITEHKELIVLQDVLESQRFIIQGLAAHLVGQPLQEVIDPFLKRCYDRGKAIFSVPLQDRQLVQEKERL